MKNPVVVAELKRLAAENDGILKAEAVVDAASDPESPLHEWFEWDDSTAAREYRLWQARTLINRVRVAVEKPAGSGVEHQVFVSVSTDRTAEGGGYRVLTDVLSDTELRQQMLLDARTAMLSFRNKYARLTELAGVFDAMEHAEQVIEEAVSAPA